MNLTDMTETALVAKPALVAAVLALLWFFEGLIPMFEGRFARPRERVRHDAANVALGVFNAAVVAVVFAGATLFVTEWARARPFGLLHWLKLPTPWVAGAAALVLFDLWQYAWHRMNHRVPVLWRFHAVHHADEELDASSGLRFHTGEIVLSSVARLLVLPVLGMTVGQLVVYEAVLLPVVLFHHGNVKLSERADRRLRWLLVTPWMHWVHHSRWQPETDSNFASVFSFWDRLFGSFRLAEDPRALALGLDGVDPRHGSSLTGMLVMPFRRRRPERSRERGDADGPEGGGGGDRGGCATQP